MVKEHYVNRHFSYEKFVEEMLACGIKEEELESKTWAKDCDGAQVFFYEDDPAYMYHMCSNKNRFITYECLISWTVEDKAEGKDTENKNLCS